MTFRYYSGLPILLYFLVRPQQTSAEASTTDDVQAQTHSGSRNVRNSALLSILVEERSHHALSLMQTLLPHKMIVLLSERRRSDLAMVAPYRAFRTHHVLAKQIHRAIDLNWLGEVIASGGDLCGCLWVSNIHRVPAG